ncbi:hypothetical protein [uncultured Prochlorococcus sp.]|uniref:hypothetical protein n=1 Tax=uncultured Prochlorococcus sp. TaxID=159733 RepID=UPI002585917F|nr:hypothetical protein [uncultured Prochlorococcus sp.]
MRDSFRPNVRLTTNILMVIGTFLIAFNLSKISTGTREEQIREDCAKASASPISLKEFVSKYNLGTYYEPYDAAIRFCKYYQPRGIAK